MAVFETNVLSRCRNNQAHKYNNKTMGGKEWQWGDYIWIHSRCWT